VNPAEPGIDATPGPRQRVAGMPRWTRPASVIGEFVGTLVRGLLPGRWRRTMRREFMDYLYEVGIRAMPATIVAALLVGLGLVLQIIYWLSFAGQGQSIDDFLVLILVRQVAPVVTALVIIGRSGSVLADEIGRLAQGGHLRQLLSQGIHPVELITIPRSFAMASACLLLTIVFMHTALWTGALAAAAAGLTTNTALDTVVDVLTRMTTADHLLLIVKPLLIGYVVAYVSIWLGMRVPYARPGVRRLLPKAFIGSLLATFAIGAITSAVF